MSEFQEGFEAMQADFGQRHSQAEERLALLDRRIQEFRNMSEGATQGVMSDTENIKVYENLSNCSITNNSM